MILLFKDEKCTRRKKDYEFNTLKFVFYRDSIQFKIYIFLCCGKLAVDRILMIFILCNFSTGYLVLK
jgi:hypothetical protein